MFYKDLLWTRFAIGIFAIKPLFPGLSLDGFAIPG